MDEGPSKPTQDQLLDSCLGSLHGVGTIHVDPKVEIKIHLEDMVDDDDGSQEPDGDQCDDCQDDDMDLVVHSHP